MTKLWEKVEAAARRSRPADRRFRHAAAAFLLWQDWCVQAMLEGLGEKFRGHVELPDRHAPRPRGDRHQRARIADGLCRAGRQRRRACARRPTEVLADWHEEHDGNLRIILPDTYGTRGFPEPRAGLAGGLDRHPHRQRRSGGGRRDRHRLVESRGEDPAQSWSSFPTGWTWRRCWNCSKQFSGRVRVSFGWGTLLTNDFRGLVPGNALAPFSLVCKAVSANGRPTVKLSDNPNKAMGPRPKSRVTSGCSVSASSRPTRSRSDRADLRVRA